MVAHHVSDCTERLALDALIVFAPNFCDWFCVARELSPCVVLLDNIDMLLGPAALSDPVQANWEGANKAGDGLKGGGSGDGSSRGEFVPRSTRTRHQAVDRMLSTLLVEIDGLYTGHAGGAAAALSSWSSGAEQVSSSLLVNAEILLRS